VQAALQRWTGGQLVDLHVSDLLNNQLPSHYDYTSWYDLLVFRRLAAGAGSEDLFVDETNGTASSARRRWPPSTPARWASRLRPRARDRAPGRLRRARALCPSAGDHGRGPRPAARRAAAQRARPT
jgi:hypothetical protein